MKHGHGAGAFASQFTKDSVPVVLAVVEVQPDLIFSLHLRDATRCKGHSLVLHVVARSLSFDDHRPSLRSHAPVKHGSVEGGVGGGVLASELKLVQPILRDRHAGRVKLDAIFAGCVEGLGVTMSIVFSVALSTQVGMVHHRNISVTDSC